MSVTGLLKRCKLRIQKFIFEEIIWKFKDEDLLYFSLKNNPLNYYTSLIKYYIR